MNEKHNDDGGRVEEDVKHRLRKANNRPRSRRQLQKDRIPNPEVSREVDAHRKRGERDQKSFGISCVV